MFIHPPSQISGPAYNEPCHFANVFGKDLNFNIPMILCIDTPNNTRYPNHVWIIFKTGSPFAVWPLPFEWAIKIAIQPPIPHKNAAIWMTAWYCRDFANSCWDSNWFLTQYWFMPWLMNTRKEKHMSIGCHVNAADGDTSFHITTVKQAVATRDTTIVLYHNPEIICRGDDVILSRSDILLCFLVMPTATKRYNLADQFKWR